MSSLEDQPTGIEVLTSILGNMFKKILHSKNFLSFIGVKSFAQVLDFAAPLFVAKALEPSIFGSFALFKMIVFLGTALFIDPVMAAFAVESNKEHQKTGKTNTTFTSVLLYVVCSSVLFVLISEIFGKQMISYTGLQYTEYRWIFLMVFLSLSIKSFLSNIFLSLDKKKIHSYVELAFSSVFLTWTLLVAITEHLSLQNILLGYPISCVALLPVFLFLIDYKSILPLKLEKENTKTILHFGFWSILGYGASYLINWGDNLVLRRFVSLDQIGIYNFAYQIFKGLIMISFMINTYFVAFVGKNITNEAAISNYLKQKRGTFILIIFALLLISAICVIPFVRLLFPPSYTRSIPIILILLFTSIFGFYVSFVIPIYNATKNYKLKQLLLVLQVVLNLGLDILLIPSFGIYGAAVATLVSYFIYTACTEFVFRRILISYYRSLKGSQ